MASERLQKILAQAGIASRRKAEELIAHGLVTVNGKVAELGEKADARKDAIKVEGKLLQTSTGSPVYIVINKPRGMIGRLQDTERRPTLASFLSKVKSRVFPVDTLEFNTEGLTLLTNDGDFTEELNKRADIPRVYHVKVKHHPDREMLSRLEHGVKLGSKTVRPHSVRLTEEFASKAMIEIVMMMPGTPDIKSLFEMRGFLVERVIRTAIGHITLKDLKPGELRYLKQSQIEALLKQPELGLRDLEKAAESRTARRVETRLREREEAQKQQKAESARAVITPGRAPKGGPRPAKAGAKATVATQKTRAKAQAGSRSPRELKDTRKSSSRSGSSSRPTGSSSRPGASRKLKASGARVKKRR